MLLRCRWGWVEVTIGDSFEYGGAIWAVCDFDLNTIFRTPDTPAGTVPLICDLVMGELPSWIPEKTVIRKKNGLIQVRFTGCSVAFLRLRYDGLEALGLAHAPPMNLMWEPPKNGR